MDTALGIGDIAVHIPRPLIPLATIIARHRRRDPQWAQALERSRKRTGQVSLRFPQRWEDAATMAAQAAYQLVARMKPAEVASLRYLAVGTETGVDHSKPIAAHVQGMLQRAGCALPGALSTFDVQHACAGGAIALVNVGAMLAVSARGERGLIICTDEARYPRGSSAELTQGAAAVALLVEPNPRLLELDLGAVGYSSRDVDDFFRPLGSTTARVKGGYSIECYRQAVEEALLDLAARRGCGLAALLEEADLLALHVPFRSLPEETLADLVRRHLGADAAAAAAFLAQRRFGAGTAPAAVVGNVYSASLFLSLAALLADRGRELQSTPAGRRVLLTAYGSGNTALAVAGRVRPAAAEVIAGWRLEEAVNCGAEASLADYDAWLDERRGAGWNGAPPQLPEPPERCFYLQAIREDGYRVYGVRSRREG